MNTQTRQYLLPFAHEINDAIAALLWRTQKRSILDEWKENDFAMAAADATAIAKYCQEVTIILGVLKDMEHGAFDVED